MSIRMLVVGTILVMSGCAPAGRDPLERAVLRENWRAVSEASCEVAGAPAAAKALCGHALLALNRNNDSVCAFAGLDATDLARWEAWTRALVLAHPRRPVARYLRGDALARLGRFADATGEFNRALRIDAGHVLALNARGVVRAIRADSAGATRDLDRAAELSPTFADAPVNRGSTLLQSKEKLADGALAAFVRALELSPDFALARAGKAYAELALGRIDAGSRDLEEAGRASPCVASLLAADAEPVLAWVARLSGGEGSDDESPGTTLTRDLGRLENGDMRAVGRVARAIGQNPALAPKTSDTLARIQQNNKPLFDRVTSRVNGGLSWTAPGGGADKLLGAMKGFNFGVFNPRDLANAQGLRTPIDHRGWGALKGIAERLTVANVTPPTPPAGATTSLDDAHIDEGDWPTAPLYGLLYAVRGNKGGVS